MNDFVDFALIRKAYDELMKEATHDLPTASQLMKKLISIPIADAAPVVHAHWIHPHWIRLGEHGDGYNWRCSACSRESAAAINYCPFCGAKMDEES